LTIQPKIVDVDYNYLSITSNILYDPKLTTYTSAQLKAQVLSDIQNFAAGTLNTFNSTFKLSTLISTVQSVSSSFITNDASIQLQKRFTPDLFSPTTYTFNFNTALKKDIYSKGVSVSPSFQIIDTKNNGVVRPEVFLEATPSSTTYLDSITIVNPGYDYTYEPTVNIIGDGSGATAQAVIANGQLVRIDVVKPGEGYTQAIVEIIGGGGSLASALAVLAGDYGILRTYYYNNGVKTILNPTAGTINYASGVITLTNFNPSDVNNISGVLTLQAIPDSTIISSYRDKIITLDATDPGAININLTAKS
jgi:hypothetical protein